MAAGASAHPAAQLNRASKFNKRATSWREMLKMTYTDWSEDKAPTLGAALAYYTVFSIAPLLVITIAVATMVFDEKTVRSQIDQYVSGLMGEAGQKGVAAMVAGAEKQEDHGIVATIISVVALVFGATGVFGQLKLALNTIWEVEPKPAAGIWGYIRERFLSFAMVLVIGFLLLVSLVLSTVLHTLEENFRSLIPLPDWSTQMVDSAISFVVITLLFAAMFKFLPDVKIRWRDVWLGAAATALLFVIGKFLLGLYLGRASFESTYGAIGSVLVILLWAYYAAQILFFGAEFTQVYAKSYGSRIEPASNARPVGEESRIRQGMGPGKMSPAG